PDKWRGQGSMLNIVPGLILFCFNRTSNAGFGHAFSCRARRWCPRLTTSTSNPRPWTLHHKSKVFMVTRPTFPSDRLSHGNQRTGKSANGWKRHSAQKRGWRYDTLAGRSLSANIARLEERLLFAKNFLQHPWMLGSLIPSSR